MTRDSHAGEKGEPSPWPARRSTRASTGFRWRPTWTRATRASPSFKYQGGGLKGNLKAVAFPAHEGRLPRSPAGPPSSRPPTRTSRRRTRSLT